MASPWVSQPSSAAPERVHLLNGIRLAGGVSAGIDLTDPMAVLAVMLVSGGTDEIRRRGAKRDELVRQLPARDAKSDADVSVEALAGRLASVRKQIGEGRKDLEKRQRQTADSKARLTEAQGTFDDLAATRQRLSAVLWWLGIGWLIWTFTGKSRAYLTATDNLAAARQHVQEAEAAEQSRRRQNQTLEAEATLISQIQTLDTEPLPLLTSFGWSHLPLRIEKLEPEIPGSLIFTHLWNSNCEHRVSDIPDGLARADELRQRVDSLAATPILLSPTADASPELRGLLGEEMLLARQIDTLADLIGGAEESEVRVALLPADASATAQLKAWRTDSQLPAGGLPYSHRRDFSAADTLLALARQAKNEIDSPESSIAERLEGLAETLRTRAQDYSDCRNTSVDTLLGRTLDEWRRWSMLPLLRRYCPSYHKSSAYRYHRLGLVLNPKQAALDPPPHPAGLIFELEPEERDKVVKGLPDSSPVARKLRILDETEKDADKDGPPAPEIAAIRREIVAMVRRQVEDGDIVALSPAAVLRFNTTSGRWHCGLCTHECRIGGKGTREERVGCPEQGLFTDEEAAMAEQYVQYEDLLVPMLSALWNEKSTWDEKNRIVREKEAELRRNMLEEEEALRKEALYFKEAARDRIVRVEDVHGEAQEVFARYQEQVESAARLDAIEPMRRRELLDELAASREKLSAVGTLKARVGEKEEDLTARVGQVASERTVVLDERVRRASDAPQFLEKGSPPRNLLFVPQARALDAGASAGSGETWLRLRRAGSKSPQLVSPDHFQTWLENLAHPGDAVQFEIFDESSKQWVPLSAHPVLRNLLPTGAATPPAFEQPLPVDDDEDVPPAVPKD